MFLRGDVAMHAFRKTVWDVLSEQRQAGQPVSGGRERIQFNLVYRYSDPAGKSLLGQSVCI